MFVAFDKQNGNRVTSIDPAWEGRLATLRELARSGALVCPACEDLLWFRITHKRRPHFAHRSLKNCPLGHDSMEVQDAKARLYTWLQGKYGDKVQLDIDLKIDGWDRFADLVVEAAPGKRFAYFIFDRQQRHRETLLASAESAGLRVHTLHTKSTHVPLNDGLRLTASQRDFIDHSDYDRSHETFGGHLYFLDGESGELLIYRGLGCIHEPNVYAGAVTHRAQLESALISPNTGELVLPADVEQRKVWIDKLARLQEEARLNRERVARQREAAKQHAAQARTLVGEPDEELDEWEETEEAAKAETVINAPVAQPAPSTAFSTPPAAPSREPEDPAINYEGPFRCELCGQMIVRHFTECTPSRGTCVCVECNRKRWLAARGER